MRVLRALLLLLLAHASTGALRAGTVNPEQSFERVGQLPGVVSAIAAVEGRGRLVVLERNGDLRLLSGDGLLDELVTRLSVVGACPLGGARDVAWNPSAPGSELFVSFLDRNSGLLAVDRLTLDGSRLVASERIFEASAPQGCERVGGGLAFDATGRLLLGVGDHGVPAQVPSPASQLGKILRMETDGSVPADSGSGTLVHATGFRNPVRIATDAANGETWVLDLAPNDSDELNRLAADANYGWPTGTGDLGSPGLTDPVHAWSPASGPTGLVVWRGADLPDTEQGDLVVSLDDGSIVQLRDPLSPTGVTEERLLYEPAGGEPSDFADLALGRDGHVYAGERSGSAHRLLLTGVEPLLEPSRRESIVPLVLGKSGSDVRIGVERRSGAVDLGLYVGTLDGTGPTHGDTTDLYYPVDGNTGEALTRFDVPLDELRMRGGDAAYVLVSARGQVDETGLGQDSQGGERPGGDNDQTPACEMPCTGPVGPNDGDCAPPFTLAEGVEGSGNVIGPAAFFADYTCRVILIHIGAEW